ncbi:ribonuclease HII [Desulforhopalus singaporensis]|uniref:Ribonuclease HII n=1 Tax=Desulforhopalus singaporensis TaxID=91360 RepID=A0A1H0MIF5_9BACT|nr:ribonuclease HII [Desulforhopalus singaporensis]SDO80046.1 RNase HII [Desulforhopalus singaporensis]
MLTPLFTCEMTGEDNLVFERYLKRQGYDRIAGCDEVGRGPLAGPVVAAAVILPGDLCASQFIDSKQLSHKKRVELNLRLTEMGAHIGIGVVSQSKIDSLNILQASLLAMKRAVENLARPAPDYILVDGKFNVPLAIPQQALIKGESKSGSIAAASIVAKVARDQMMTELHDKFPQYNFIKNKGYPTREHREAIIKHGPCPLHRLSFKGVREHA